MARYVWREPATVNGGRVEQVFERVIVVRAPLGLDQRQACHGSGVKRAVVVLANTPVIRRWAGRAQGSGAAIERRKARRGGALARCAWHAHGQFNGWSNLSGVADPVGVPERLPDEIAQATAPAPDPASTAAPEAGALRTARGSRPSSTVPHCAPGSQWSWSRPHASRSCGAPVRDTDHRNATPHRERAGECHAHVARAEAPPRSDQLLRPRHRAASLTPQAEAKRRRLVGDQATVQAKGRLLAGAGRRSESDRALTSSRADCLGVHVPRTDRDHR